MHYEEKVKENNESVKTSNIYIFTKNVKLYNSKNCMYNINTDKKDLAEARSSIPLMEYNALIF